MKTNFFLKGITIKSKEIAKKFASLEGCVRTDNKLAVKAPDGYPFYVIDEEKEAGLCIVY